VRGKVARREGVRRDLITLYRYHARESGLRTADRFLDASEATSLRLAKLPGLGTWFDPEDIPIDVFRDLMSER
jgi:plasmid stabilization system protein ParE